MQQWTILISDWLNFKKSSLKLQFQMICQVQIMYVRSFKKNHHFILLWQKTWMPWTILVSDRLKLKKSPLKLQVQVICKYKSQQKLFISSCFGKHGCHGNCCFWLAETLIDWLVFNANFSNISAISWHAEASKVVSFEITSPTWTNYLLVGSNIYVRFSAKIHHFVLLWQKTWLIWAILVSDWLNY